MCCKGSRNALLRTLGCFYRWNVTTPYLRVATYMYLLSLHMSVWEPDFHYMYQHWLPGSSSTLFPDSTPFIVPALKAGIREWGYCCQVCFTSSSIATSLAFDWLAQIFAVWWGNSVELQFTFARLTNSVRATSKTALVIGHMWVIATCTMQHSFNQTPETCMLQLLASKYRNYHLKLLRWSTTSTITSSNSFNMSVCTRDATFEGLLQTIWIRSTTWLHFEA